MDSTEARLKRLMIGGLKGDGAAHGQLLAELAPLLRGFYRRRLPARDADVEDLVQETLIAVHTRRESFDTARPFTAWAYAIARYKLADAYRRAGRRATVPIEEAGPIADDAHDAEAGGATMDLERLMADLPENQRRAIHYVKIEGLSIAEAAEKTGLSQPNVKVSIHRGLKALMALARKAGP